MRKVFETPAMAAIPAQSGSADVVLAVQVLEELGWATYDYPPSEEEAQATFERAVARHPESDWRVVRLSPAGRADAITGCACN